MASDYCVDRRLEQYLFFAVGIMLVPLVVFLFLNLVLGAGPNLGLPFGYYGNANRATARLGAIPGVEILDVRYHEDVTLEDFFVTVRVHGVHEADIDFVESNRGRWVRQVDEWEAEVLPSFVLGGG